MPRRLAGLWATHPGHPRRSSLVRAARSALVMAVSMALAAVGFGLLTQLDGVTGLAALVTGSVVFALRSAPMMTLATDLLVGIAPPERAGAALAISETSSELGGALGIAVLGSIGSSVYRGQVADAVPAGVPPQTAEAARDTLGGALAVAGQLPSRRAPGCCRRPARGSPKRCSSPSPSALPSPSPSWSRSCCEAWTPAPSPRGHRTPARTDRVRARWAW